MSMPKVKPSLVLREEADDWAIVFDPDTGAVFGLDPVSLFVWKSLDGNHSLEQIVGEMSEVFSDVPLDAQAHLEEFLSSLAGDNLILEDKCNRK